MTEQELRDRLADELRHAMHVEGDRPTIHAIAHSFARVLAEDHERLTEQLERSGLLRAAAPPPGRAPERDPLGSGYDSGDVLTHEP